MRLLPLLLLIPGILLGLEFAQEPILPFSAHLLTVADGNGAHLAAKAGKNFMRSTDGGLTWTTVSDVFTNDLFVSNTSYGSFLLSSDHSGATLCIGRSGSNRAEWATSQDGGNSWSAIQQEELDLAFTSGLHLLADAHGTLFAIGSGGYPDEGSSRIRRSTDGGRYWTTVCTGSEKIHFVMARAGDDLVTLRCKDDLTITGCSMDGGQTWVDWPQTKDQGLLGNRFLNDGMPRMIGNKDHAGIWLTGTSDQQIRISLTGAWLGSNLGSWLPWEGQFQLNGIIAHPDHAEIQFAEHRAHLAQSTDGGRTWGLFFLGDRRLSDKGVLGWVRRDGRWWLLIHTCSDPLPSGLATDAIVALDVMGQRSTATPPDVGLPVVSQVFGSIPNGQRLPPKHCHPFWSLPRTNASALLSDGIDLWSSQPDGHNEILPLSPWPSEAAFRAPIVRPQIIGDVWFLDARNDRSPGLLSIDGGMTWAIVPAPEDQAGRGTWIGGLLDDKTIACVYHPASLTSRNYLSAVSRDWGKTWKTIRNTRAAKNQNEPHAQLFAQAWGTLLVQDGESPYATRNGRSWTRYRDLDRFNFGGMPMGFSRWSDGSYFSLGSSEGQEWFFPNDAKPCRIQKATPPTPGGPSVVTPFRAEVFFGWNAWRRTVLATRDGGKTWFRSEPRLQSTLPCRAITDATGTAQLVTTLPSGEIAYHPITNDFSLTFSLPCND